MSAPSASPYITSHTDDLRGLVRQYRANATALRRLDLGTTYGTANVHAMVRRAEAADLAEKSLIVAGHATLAGLLLEEYKLNLRLLQARRAGIKRPELQKKLTTARKAITAYLRSWAK